ncbi:DEAD/DEAH box helicase [Gammaproteobacteria bacterium LSUCC0112]|nr:DEAD/DEAH box helicase [Gammaproteobacteria bacterium LSUCC0112]
MSTTSAPDLSFAELNLPAFLLETLSKVGYEKPSPIQQETIPALLEGHDIVGMAQTGTGKTAAFALPVLAKIDVNNPNTQALVLCPTRELAIQVAEAFQTYAQGMKGFHVLPVYGGQEMGRQLQALRRGVHVVVGTPGRLLDHLNRRSLNLSTIKTLVLDEADEMLRMGFIDDVELILQQTSADRQVALFSATMPTQIRHVAEKYLRNPIEVKIKTATSTNADIEQLYWLVQGTNKLDALTRMLEVEEFDGMLIFVRTKNSTQELADKLSARGFSASALNGDMNQQLRTRTVEQLKNGQLDIVVATDVAARGLDVERISHVVNYDIPYDNEAYVHRIGRTGRAGRSGKAILFVAPREQRMLQSIERTTRKKIERMELPTRSELIQHRSQQFKNTIAAALENGNQDFFRVLLAEFCHEHECSIEDASAAMAFLLQKDRPLEPSVKDVVSSESGYGKAPAASGSATTTKVRAPRREASESFVAQDTPAPRPARSKPPMHDAPPRLTQEDIFAEEFAMADREDKPRKRRERTQTEDGEDVAMERFRIQVGHEHGVSPREIVGAIANEGGIEGRYIGRINIYDTHTTIDLPQGMPEDVFKTLSRTRVCNQPLAIEKMTKEEAAEEARTSPRGPRGPRPSGDRERGERPSADRFSRDRSPSDRPSSDRPPREGFRASAGPDRDRAARPDDRKPRFSKDRSGTPTHPASTSARPPRYTNSDGGFATRRQAVTEPGSAPRFEGSSERPRSAPRAEGARDASSYDRKPRSATATPRRSPPRDAFVEPTFAPRSFEDRPARTADADKAAKDKKRGGPKVRADRDKGKRRTPAKRPT